MVLSHKRLVDMYMLINTMPNDGCKIGPVHYSKVTMEQHTQLKIIHRSNGLSLLNQGERKGEGGKGREKERGRRYSNSRYMLNYIHCICSLLIHAHTQPNNNRVKIRCVTGLIHMLNRAPGLNKNH